jgi:PAS domain S-box-containing protein
VPQPVLQETQRAVLRDVLAWALPATFLMPVVTLTTAIATGMFDALWSRGVPSLVLFAFVGVATVAFRRERLTLSLAWLIAGLVAVLGITLTFNGGLRAPAAMLFLYLVSLFGWVFGRRGAAVMTLIAIVVLTLVFALGSLQVLPEPPALPLIGEYVMLVVMCALMWSTSAAPPERMRAALLEAATRERELRAEQERRLEAAQLFQAVFDQSSNLMGLLSPEGVVQQVNRAALALGGMADASAVVGQPFSQTPWWPPGERTRLEQHLARAATGQGVEHFETTHVDAQGQLRAIDFSLSPFRDEAGRVRFLLAEGRDITEVVRARERQSTTQRLELVGQLAGGVAHDFNNVLMAMLASAEVLRLDLETDGPAAPRLIESIDTIVSTGTRASDLTRRLLSFARRGTVEKRPLSMHALLDSTARLLQRTLPPTVQIRCEPSAPTDLVQGDVASLESALINLGVNARDAMPRGGTLTFSTARVELDAEACRASGFDVKPGAYLRVSVRDTGTGIAPEHRARVFEPFFTTKEEGKGTGLGLASVFGVVRDHQGLVQLESELGEGTTFHLTFPLSSAQAPVSAPAPRPRGFPGVKALVVDDEAALRTMIPRLLKRLGIECDVAASAEEALERYSSAHSLLVTDVVLPGRRGNELAAELLTRAPALKVLLISGYQKDSELSSLPAERVRLLAKPFTFEALQHTLAELLPPG